MPPFLVKLVSNPGVRKAVVALVLAVLAAYGISFSSGCSRAALPPAAAKALAVYECQRDVLESVVPRAVAEDLVMAARAGNGQYVLQQLLGLGLTPEVIEQAADAFHQCAGPQEPAPAIAVEPS
jgi:hypothetical protein